MFVKLTSGFTGAVLLFRKLVLRDFWRTGSKSCKPEVTFAIYQGRGGTEIQKKYMLQNSCIYINSLAITLSFCYDKVQHCQVLHIPWQTH